MIKHLLFIAAMMAASFATARNLPLPQFGSAEHKSAGDDIKLQFASDISGTEKIKLALPNGLILTYGEIVTLAGDFYGDPEKPISLGKTEQDRRQRFWRAYSTLAIDPGAVTEAPKILAVVQDEELQLQDGMKKGESPDAVYDRIATENDVAWNCITGGLCAEDYPGISKELLHKIYYLKQGRYLKLEDKNFDHFGQEAWLAYSVGHKIAVDMAISAGRTLDKKKLAESYAVNAFANHYLSDGFSTGHLRTPHLSLYNHVSPATVGSLLASYMHYEDNEYGLTISNRYGETWKAYGDAYYFDPRNKKNRDILLKVMQASADEIFAAYNYGLAPTDDKVAALVPDLKKANTLDPSHNNIAPLFYWDEKKQALLRRVDISNPYDYEWTENWTGWGTLTELMNAKGSLRSLQGELLSHPDTQIPAILAGLINDSELLRWFQSFQTTDHA
ncbi:MAG: phospholipase [Gammaproteobacteria bacterium]|nr:phospholipase [Gammaproteobacteria bacterium]